MSVLGLMESTADTAQTTPDLSSLPSTNTERFGAAWNAAQTDDRYWNVQAARKTRADKVIDDLHAMTGERLKNPYDNAPTTDEIRENLGQPTTVIYAKRLEKLRTATRNAKAGIEQLGGLPQDYLDVDSIDADIASQSGAARARDERMSGTGGGFGGFLGSMAGETVSPHGIMTSFIPVTRMGGAVAEAGVLAFAKNVAKEAAFQGGTQGAAQSLATIVDYNTRKQFGTEQTNEQILEEIISAAAGGALLGGAFRAAHLGILKLASRGVEIPPAALDSARVMEERDLYGDKNPLRIAPAQMEVATDQATSAAALGRAASPNVDVPAAAAAPTPITAYHGTGRTFEHFDMKYQSQKAIFLTDKAGIAQRHAGGTGRVLETELSLDNPREVDWGGGLYNTERMNDLIREAKDAGHDGLIIKNIRDFSGPETSTTYAVFKPESARIVPGTEPGAPAAAGAPPVPAAEAEAASAPAPSSTGLGELGGAGKAIGANLYEGLFGALERGETKFAGITDPMLTVARADFDAGRIKSAADLADFANKRGAFASAEGAVPSAVVQTAEQMDPALQRLVKSLDERPDNPMQAPRPPPPEPKPQPTTAKLPGESAEDKAIMQQARALLDSETQVPIDPNVRQAMEIADIQEREAKAAVGCIVGAI